MNKHHSPCPALATTLVLVYIKHMTRTTDTAEFHQNLGHYFDVAQRQPIATESRGRHRSVLVSPAFSTKHSKQRTIQLYQSCLYQILLFSFIRVRSKYLLKIHSPCTLIYKKPDSCTPLKSGFVLPTVILLPLISKLPQLPT